VQKAVCGSSSWQGHVCGAWAVNCELWIVNFALRSVLLADKGMLVVREPWIVNCESWTVNRELFLFLTRACLRRVRCELFLNAKFLNMISLDLTLTTLQQSTVKSKPQTLRKRWKVNGFQNGCRLELLLALVRSW
jgi:hypothetical protein